MEIESIADTLFSKSCHIIKAKPLKRCFLALALASLFIPCVLAQTPTKRNARANAAKYHITPTKLKASPTGVYIPKDLPDTFVELNKMLSPALRVEMKQGKENAMSQYHLSLGVWLRNNWGLWKGLRLAKWFNTLGIFHPDDMSSIARP